MAIPELAPVTCPKCRKLIVERLTGQLYATCPRCKTPMVADSITQTITRASA